MSVYVQHVYYCCTKSAADVGSDLDPALTLKAQGSTFESIFDQTRCREKEGAICVNGDGRGRPPVLFHAGNVRVVDHLEAVAGGGFPNKGLPFAVHSKGNGSKARYGNGIPGAGPNGQAVSLFNA